MSTRKIADAPKPPCPDPEHQVPSMEVFEPGTWEHTCPSCGNVIRFVVHPQFSYAVQGKDYFWDLDRRGWWRR